MSNNNNDAIQPGALVIYQASKRSKAMILRVNEVRGTYAIIGARWVQVAKSRLTLAPADAIEGTVLA